MRCLLSAFVIAMGLCVAHGAGAQTPKASASGIIYLLKADRPGFPSRDLAKEPCWTNPYVQGVLLWAFWSKVQPREGAIDWSFFDQGVALAAKIQQEGRAAHHCRCRNSAVGLPHWSA